MNATRAMLSRFHASDAAGVGQRYAVHVAPPSLAAARPRVYASSSPWAGAWERSTIGPRVRPRFGLNGTATDCQCGSVRLAAQTAIPLFASAACQDAPPFVVAEAPGAQIPLVQPSSALAKATPPSMSPVAWARRGCLGARAHADHRPCDATTCSWSLAKIILGRLPHRSRGRIGSTSTWARSSGVSSCTSVAPPASHSASGCSRLRPLEQSGAVIMVHVDPGDTRAPLGSRMSPGSLARRERASCAGRRAPC